MNRFLSPFLVVTLLLLTVLRGAPATVQAAVDAAPTIPAGDDDPLLRSEVLDRGSNSFFVTSEPFCTSPRDPNNSQPYPYEPRNCPQDPINPNVDPVEIATFQQIYKQKDANAAGPDFTYGNRLEERIDQNQAAVNRRHIDSIALDLTGQGFDSFVSAWEGVDRTIKVYVTQPVSLTLQESRFTIDGPLAPGASGDANGRIHLAAGDATGDGAEEFAVAWQGADGLIHLNLYANRGGALPELVASVADEPLPVSPTFYANFAVTLGDFDGDQRAEVALVATRQNLNGSGPGVWNVHLRVYDLLNNALVPKVGELVFNGPAEPSNTGLANLNLDLTSGDFDGNGVAELALVAGARRSVQDVDPGGDDTFVLVMRLGDDTGTPTVDPLEMVVSSRQTALDLLVPDRNSPTNLVAADLNRDGRSDLVLAVGADLLLFTVDDQLQPTQQLRYDTMTDGMPGVQDVTARLGYRFLGVRQVNADRVEIALAAPTVFPESGSLRQTLNLVVYVASSNLQSLTLVAKALGTNEIETNPDGYRTFALAVGGPSFLQLGDYTKRGTVTNVGQPLVIVKAPPTHYDIFGEEAYDVSDCFTEDIRLACGGLNNKFTATFTKGSQSQRSISTQLNSDWAISTSLGGNLSAVGIALEANLNRKYGEGFEKIEGQTATYTDVTEDYVWQDDRLLASVVDYDVYEFEVLANGELVGNVLVVRPRGTPQLTWFSAKDWTGYAFIPDSQPANILSYAETVEEIRNGGGFAAPIMPLTNLQAQTISWDTSFGQTRTITYQEDVDQSAATTQTLEMEVGAKLGGAKDFGKVSAGLEIGVQNSYRTAEISTQKVNLGEWFGVKIVYGNINSQIADANYRITPYLYWATNGAIVMDYAVQPELSRPGFPASWWEIHYGQQPDPAFLLPWRNERERLGYATPDYKLNLTKDILFDPPNAQAGETVTITARINNYSLRATTSPVAVRFYLGDPDAGGTPLVGVNGETAVTVPGNLAARGSALVRMGWRIPEGQRFPRIYALIDPDGAIAEVHEDNNKAYAILGAYDGSGPPLAGFNPSQSNSNSLTVSFSNTSSGEYTGTVWEFGDGATSTERNPTHTYATAGEYIVTLRLTGGIDGTSDLVQQRIRVGTTSGGGDNGNEHSLYLPVVVR
jgi:hypothetical protein